jgi:hypothetical protein
MNDTSAPQLDDYMSAHDLADYLGVPEKTLARLHGLRGVSLGQTRARVYSKSTVAAWLARRMATESTER